MKNDEYTVTSKWDPKEQPERANSTKLPLTVTIDLVLKQIKELVRLTIEARYRICSQYGLHWSFDNSPIFNQFVLHLKEVKKFFDTPPKNVVRNFVFFFVFIEH